MSGDQDRSGDDARPGGRHDPPAGRGEQRRSRREGFRPAPGAVGRAMRSTIGRESTTFGFSILVTAAFGLLNATHGTPGVAAVFWFAVGAVASFTLLETVLSRGFRRAMPQHGTRVLAIGTSLNVVSVTGGLATGWLVTTVTEHAAAWALTPFVAATVYLVLESLETALGERLAAAGGDPDADQVEA